MQTTANDNEFLAAEYNVATTTYPYAQVLNKESESDCGFFVSIENLSAAEWQLPEDQQYRTITWKNSGEKTAGIIISHPRLVILAQSPLFMVERSTGLSLGAFDPEYYRQHKLEVTLKTKYLIYFVNEQNQLRHNLPMQLTMKGAAGATFGEHLLQFRAELEKAFALFYKQPIQRKSAKFHAMGIFCIRTEPQLKGDEQKSWVCTTVRHEQPNQDNWRNYFLGFTSLRERLEADFENKADFGKLTVARVQQLNASLSQLPIHETANGSIYPPSIDLAPEYTSNAIATEVGDEQDPDIPF